MRQSLGILALFVSVLVTPLILRAQSSDRPPAPSLSVNEENSSIDVSWAPIEDALRYQLWVWESNSWSRLDDDDLTGTSFTHADLHFGVRYWYTYRAVFSSGTSNWSQYGSAVLGLSPAAPILTATLEGNAVSINWNAVEQAVRYQLWIWESGSWRVLAPNLTQTNFRHTMIEPGTTYHFTMKAQDSAGRSSDWSDYVSVQVPTNVVPETPTATPTPDPNATVTPTATATPTPTATTEQASTGLSGITIAPENRCTTYDSDDYPYPQSVEQEIVDAMGGRIYGPYTGTYYNNTRQTDIEHIVARSEAHDSGLCAASASTKSAFSRDLLNLTLASPSVNRHQKVAKDVAEWLPSLNRCWYVNRVVSVKRKYNLTMDQAEASKAQEVLASCTSTSMIFIERTATATLTPTPTLSSTGPTPTPSPTVDALGMWDSNGNGRITCAEAREHGIPTPINSDHPAYPYMDDRDNDGLVCE